MAFSILRNSVTEIIPTLKNCKVYVCLIFTPIEEQEDHNIKLYFSKITSVLT
jgi:hypothetical protein